MGHQDQKVVKNPVWGDYSRIMPYNPSSENEKQVYLQGGKLTLLTNKRLIQLIRMRPIDKLYNFLEHFKQSDRQDPLLYEEFENFAQLYTLEETCVMLLQIITDSQETYLVSQKMLALFDERKRQVIDEHNRITINHANYGRHNAGRSGTNSLNRRVGPHQASQLSNHNQVGRSMS